MSTGTIVAIVVVALILVALFAFILPRARARARERRIEHRRQEVAGAHREVANERLARAELAEREARRERAEAELHESRANLHEQGLADDRLEEDHDRFVREDRDGDGVDDRREAPATDRRDVR
jgi:Flp pilus assembly protein TadB